MVELHQEGSVPAACTAGLFDIGPDSDNSLYKNSQKYISRYLVSF